MAISGDPVLELFAASLREETERALEGQVPSLAVADPALAQFCSDLRESTELELQGSASLSIPPRAPRKRRLWASAAGLAAAAAMALLVVNLPGVGHLSQKIQGELASMAPWNKGEQKEQKRLARSRDRVSPAPRVNSSPEQTRVDIESPALDEALETQEPVALPKQAEVSPVAPAPKKLSDAALMRQAHALWKKGKTKRAQRLFRRVAYRSPDRDVAQEAFADLFSIGRQLGGLSVLRQEWSRYLKTFPNGRYVQDAMAGQCSSSPKPAIERGCWSRYLKRFPRGMYARKAKKVLGQNR